LAAKFIDLLGAPDAELPPALQAALSSVSPPIFKIFLRKGHQALLSLEATELLTPILWHFHLLNAIVAV
jgi:hypothetical protein